jgi:predicted dithiol-disulfide oxidoreductase (DUF899 family)
MASEVKERGLDLITPAWTMLDLTPQGRGEWRPKLEYPTKSQASGAWSGAVATDEDDGKG